MARPGLARAALAVMVLALAVLAQAQIWTAPPAYPVGGRGLNALLALAATLPLLLARRQPLPVTVAVLAAVVADHVLGGEGGYQWFAVVVVVFSLGRHAGARTAAAGVLLVAVLVAAVDVPRLRAGAPLDEVLPAWAILAGVLGLGRWLRSRRREVDDLEGRAEALQRDQQAAAREAVVHERAAIARELHDLVAHSMAVIVLQAQAGRRVLATDPAAAEGALAAIEATGREGMTELRRLLDVLHVEEARDDLDPRPGLAQLPALVDRVGRAGLPVELAVDGPERPLPAAVDLSLYRVAQEALTNALRHAGRARARVGVTYRAGEVEVRVVDDGDGSAPAGGTGHGLDGMRERVRLFGGTLEAGPMPAGGFSVRAVLPTERP
ncbi:sensor histidine kinase [Oryzobacter sp. R7]|uniref:sensor histidine kinase n=1 Tax=Oryzobacter faecalis TaxID=3388656 RepID=UPI00398CD335